MAGPQHSTREYRRARAEMNRAQEAGQWLTCRQPECVMPDRTIAPNEPAHMGHDDTGTVLIGPVHARCNTRDGAIRGNKMRGKIAAKVAVRRRVL